MDWQETLDFYAQDLLNGAPKTSKEYERLLRERVDDSLNDEDDYTFVGVSQEQLDGAIESYVEMYF